MLANEEIQRKLDILDLVISALKAHEKRLDEIAHVFEDVLKFDERLKIVESKVE